MKTLLLGIIILSLSCSSPEKRNPEEKIADIIQTELDFARMADEAGVAAAFYYFADDSAVISRGDRIIKGKEAILEYYETSLRPGTKLKWAPDFADASGDIGYTYGRYTHSVPDSSGNITVNHGIFHTVWKLQDNGTWRFVWD